MKLECRTDQKQYIEYENSHLHNDTQQFFMHQNSLPN